ncbi:hypothetical protein EV651_111232 [Kribbella sp. VKM Ac-2571]|uniref:hypothetical protein n=1 Tax=Kribbella sp. VKM Ac-2571 TaxID=2512222 RepID=UPI00105C2185|nr:hypothetical protein [Kribbella sp. VKM Ac-2571]TDO57503.1 hypothetical protein EV651_111232 [Kribbella sp. VKM Ac-2571]
MNLDFGLEPLFSWYVVLLCLSGVVMVALAASKTGDRSAGSRALSAVAGLGFLGYGIYLGFIFDGGSYMMFFQAFILPVLLVVNFVRALLKNDQTELQPQPYPGVPMQPQAGAPAQPQPYQGGSMEPHQPYADGPTQQYPAQQYPAQPQPYPVDPTQPRPTQPS